MTPTNRQANAQTGVSSLDATLRVQLRMYTPTPPVNRAIVVKALCHEPGLGINRATEC